MKNNQTCCDNKGFIALAIVAIIALLLSVILLNQVNAQDWKIEQLKKESVINTTRLNCINNQLQQYFSNPAARDNAELKDVKNLLWDMQRFCNTQNVAQPFSN